MVWHHWWEETSVSTLLAQKGWAMEKNYCYIALAVSGVMALVFLLDLIMGIPFGGGSAFMIADILGLVASLIVAYLGFNALKDLK
jgi:uncharacterized membrane protein YhaH (DUF805 family)